MWKEPLAERTDRWKRRRGGGGGWRESGMRCAWRQTRLDARSFNLQQEPYLELLVFFIRLHKKTLPTSPPSFFFPFPATGTYERMASGAMAQLTRHDTAMCVTATKNVRTRNENKNLPWSSVRFVCVYPGSVKNDFSRVTQRGPAVLPCVMFWMVGQCADWFEMTIFIDVSAQASPPPPPFSFLQLHHLMDSDSHSSQTPEL